MKIALFNNDCFSMLQFRGGLINKLIALGHEVTLIIPDGPEVKEFVKRGAKVKIFSFSRFFSPFQDLMLIIKLYSFFRKNKFDIIHNMTIKPNIYGTLAAKMAGQPKVVCLVSGAGFLFEEHSSKTMIFTRKIISLLYKLALSQAHKIWFQNPDDKKEFEEKKLISEGKGIVILSGGINVEEFQDKSVPKETVENIRKELGIENFKKVVLLVSARLIYSKGIIEFLNAATSLEEEFKDWHFVLVAPPDPGTYGEIPKSFILENKPKNMSWVSDFIKDIAPFLSLSTIVTLPSFGREGVPRCLIEALSFGRAIVTTDSIGCREVVEEGFNGYLIEPRSHASLTQALKRLMTDPLLRDKMGKNSRKLAEEKFSSKIVIDKILKDLYEIPC
jgi:N,N'-diacetylbacillosaminyl-diphospho-undecaprenol alpha-1,3-N-acetylgalactosaminyltransferase